MAKKKQRKMERDFYAHTQKNANASLHKPREIKKSQTGPTPRWHYQVPTYGLTGAAFVVTWLLVVFFYRGIMSVGAMNDMSLGVAFKQTFTFVFPILLIGTPILGFILHKKFYATWYNNNAMWLSDDIQEYENDTYLRTMDHLFHELDLAPDAGLGFDGHASTLMGHAMMSNKGIKKIDMPVYDPTVPGQIKRDEDGNIVYKRMEMFDKELGDKLFDMSGVPQKAREWFDATDYAFNAKIARKDGGDGKKRSGAFGRKEYDKVSDYINNEFYPLDTDAARPAGVYFYDSRPVNTILIAITRGGKVMLLRSLGDQRNAIF